MMKKYQEEEDMKLYELFDGGETTKHKMEQ